MVEFRGRVTACMLYDDRPIIDAFVRIDDDRVLGVMDMKGDPSPYFFVLKRDPSDLGFGPSMAQDERFMELFDMEVQNRAFALKVNKDLGETAVSDEDKAFYTAWIAFETFLQKCLCARCAANTGCRRPPRTGANLQAGLARFGAGILPDRMMTKDRARRHHQVSRKAQRAVPRRPRRRPRISLPSSSSMKRRRSTRSAFVSRATRRPQQNF